MFKKISLAALAAFAVLPVSVAYAADPPPAEYLGTITIFNQNNPHPGPDHLLGPGSIATGGASLTFGVSPTPFIQSSAVLNGDDAYTINGTLKYYFVVNGPASADPIDMDAHIFIHDDQEHGLSSAIVTISALNSVTESFGAPSGLDYSHTFNETVGFQAMVGVSNYVKLTIGSQGLANIYADPFITFAQDHPGYSLSFSSDVSNLPSGGVPEPASWALMILGFGGAGAMLRRRARAIRADGSPVRYFFNG